MAGVHPDHQLPYAKLVLSFSQNFWALKYIFWQAYVNFQLFQRHTWATEGCLTLETTLWHPRTWNRNITILQHIMWQALRLDIWEFKLLISSQYLQNWWRKDSLKVQLEPNGFGTIMQRTISVCNHLSHYSTYNAKACCVVTPAGCSQANLLFKILMCMP